MSDASGPQIGTPQSSSDGSPTDGLISTGSRRSSRGLLECAHDSPGHRVFRGLRAELPSLRRSVPLVDRSAKNASIPSDFSGTFDSGDRTILRRVFGSIAFEKPTPHASQR